MDEGSRLKKAAAPRRRTRPRIPGHCAVDRCTTRPVIAEPLKLCGLHATHVIDIVQERNAATYITRCIWPKCREFEYASELKLCKTHAAIVLYQADKHLFVKAQYWDLTSFDRQIEHALAEERREAERAKKRAQQGTIYAVLNGHTVKIGWTSNLDRRMREYPPASTLLVSYPGTRKDEAALHRKFAHLTTHGREWFPYAPQVVEWVERMVAEHGEPEQPTFGAKKVKPRRPHADKPMIKPKGYIGGSGRVPGGKTA